MNKKVQKIASLLILVVMLVTITTNVFAVFTPGDVKETDPNGIQTVKDYGNQIVGGLKVIGVIASVVVLVFLGIKYMIGSAEQKAEYKKTFIPYLVGAALVFAGAVFADGIYDFFSTFGTKK